MIIAVLLLTILGIVVIYSSSPSLAIQQGLFAIFGLFIYLGLSNLDFRALQPLIKPIYFLAILFLIIVFILGFETRGSVRWIPLGLFNFQPSEFAKVVVILSLASFWKRNEASFKNILISFLIIFPIFILIFRQPDLGTALTILFIWTAMLFAANLSFFKILFMGFCSLLLIPGTWFFLKDYQKQRIISFLYPNHDPLGIGYNVIQSMIAVGSGQIFGRGLGQGTQSRLQFLPEFRTDFIFASIAEELGALGSLIVLGLYAVIIYFFFRTLRHSADRMGELIVVGVMGMMIFQMMVNIGMNIGIMPVTGITLPLLSYGGSSIIITYMALGLVESVSRYGTKRRDVFIDY